MSVIGIGIDIVEVERAQRILDRHGGRALARFLLPAERAYVEEMAGPAAHFAVRVAAKEAAYKALQSLPGMRAVSWHDLEVIRTPEGRPILRMGGPAAEVEKEYTLHLSLTHTHKVASAVAVLSRA